MMAAYVDAALVYADQLGAAVVPVRGKRPAPAHGYRSASSDPQEICGMFEATRATGVGIAATERFVLVDVDCVEAVAELDELPPTLTARSGGGSRWHLYYRRPAGLRLSYRRDRFPEGIEIKLDGGGFVAPPSVHPETGRRYT